MKLISDQIRQSIDLVLVSTGKLSSGGVVSSFWAFENILKFGKFQYVALLDFAIEKGSVVSLLLWFIGCCFLSKSLFVTRLMFNCVGSLF
jgi:hypothetical protein